MRNPTSERLCVILPVYNEEAVIGDVLRKWDEELGRLGIDSKEGSLAARHHLRSFEIRVPQHDRTTGRGSLAKWKLFKAAVRSFIQTISFAFHRAHP